MLTENDEQLAGSSGPVPGHESFSETEELEHGSLSEAGELDDIHVDHVSKLNKAPQYKMSAFSKDKTSQYEKIKPAARSSKPEAESSGQAAESSDELLQIRRPGYEARRKRLDVSKFRSMYRFADEAKGDPATMEVKCEKCGEVQTDDIPLYDHTEPT